MFIITVAKLFYIGWGPLDLVPDEAHYWDWSRNLDLSYYSKGPVISYTIYLGTAIGEIIGVKPPNPAFWVRFPAVINSFLLGIIIWFFAQRLWKENRTSWFTVMLFAAVPAFAIGSVLMTIDNPLLLFWTLFVYLFFLAIDTKKPVYWYLAGISFGLGFLSKYTMIALIPSVLLFLAVSKEHREWFKRKELYICFLIAIICSMPVVIWNVQHDWVGIKHLSSQAGMGKPFISNNAIGSLLEFIGIQAGIISPGIFCMVIGGFFLVVKTKDYRYRFLFWMAVPLAVFYLMLSLHKNCQPNWPIPIYITGILIAGGLFSSRKLKFLKISVIIGFVLWIVFLGLPWLSHAGLKFPEGRNPFKRVVGWKQLGIEVGRVYEEYEKKGECFIFSDTYQLTSELAFYVPGEPRTYCINTGRRMNQYDLWESPKIGENGLYIKHRDQEMDEKTASLFEKWEKLPLVKIPAGKEYSVFLCYNFKGIKKIEDEITY